MYSVNYCSWEHNSVKRINIKSRPNLFITPEMKQLMIIRDSWRKKGRKANDNGVVLGGNNKKREVANQPHVNSEAL